MEATGQARPPAPDRGCECPLPGPRVPESIPKPRKSGATSGCRENLVSRIRFVHGVFLYSPERPSFFFFFSMIPTECEKGDPWNYPVVASDPRGPKASFRVRPQCAPSAELSPSPGPPPDAEVGTPVFGSFYVRRHRLSPRNLYRELSPSALFRA